jgi:hypothetical protein
MRLSFRQSAFCCLMAVPFCGISQAAAQLTVVHQPGPSTQIGPSLGPTQFGMVTTGGADFGIPANAEVVKNRPYQAQAVTEMKQTLVNGSHIVQTTTATVARDSEGRTVRMQKLSSIGPWRSSSDSSSGDGPTLTSIFDPVTKTHIDYTSDRGIAHVMTVPTLPAGAVMASGFAVSSVATVNGGGPVVFSVQGHTLSPQTSGPMEAKTESLGTRTIEAVQVDGTRVTSTIPTGTIGNDKDLVITRETWYSPDLQLVLLSTQDDPRFGQTTYSLTNIERSEPDESLFQVPSGYKIEKAPAPVKIPAQ